jgi:hypothetical protein
MALPFGETQGAREPRTLAILAKTIYRELRNSGFEARDVMALAGELLSQVTSEVRAGKLPQVRKRVDTHADEGHAGRSKPAK